MQFWESEGVRNVAVKNWEQLERSGKETSDGGKATPKSLMEMIRGRAGEYVVSRLLDRSWTGFPNRKGSKEADVGTYIEVRNSVAPSEGVRIRAGDHGTVWVLTSGPRGPVVIAHGWIDIEEAARFKPKGTWDSFLVPLSALRKMVELREQLGSLTKEGITMGPEDEA